jgi:hypothetical protein
MQQALDALKVMRHACFAENTLKTADTAITALRDRLEQPERQWVGLTDEEIGVPTEPIQPHETIMFARVIEALIKEKNK